MWSWLLPFASLVKKPRRLDHWELRRLLLPDGVAKAVSPLSRLALEPLEDRVLLSVAPAGAEFQVNTYTPLDQLTSIGTNNSARDVAIDAARNVVIVWQ